MNASTAAVPPLPLRHCYWVIPGLLLAGEHPDGATRDKTKDRLKKLLAAGIECFVDLTKPTELPRYDTLLPFYVEYTRKAIKDHGLPASRDQMIEILEAVGNSMRAGRPVYVHCRAGIGRTGTVIGCLLVERGLSGEGALDELNRLWQQSKRSKTWEFVPETEAQTQYIRQWQPSLKGGGFEMNAAAAAISAVGPISTASDMRPGALTVADVQSRAASHATGAGQARAAMENIAAGKGRKGSKISGATYAGGGLAAAAANARAAHEASTEPGAGRASTEPTPAGDPAQPVSRRSPAGSHQPGPSELPPELAAALASAEAVADRVEAESTARRATRQPQAPQNPTSASPSAERPAGQAHQERSAGQAAQERSMGQAPRERPVGQAPMEPNVASAPRPATPWVSPPPDATGASRDAAARGKGAGATADVDPLLDPTTLMAARALRERFVGALLGLATGDAVAAATQYRRPGSFTPVGDMLGGGPFDLPRGAWSDDTATALCLAESLLECNGFDPRDQVQRYARWQQEGYLSATGQCVGITANTARSLAIAKWRRMVFPGSHDPEQLDPEPLSRIAPVALYYFASLETTLQQAAESSRTTCQAPAVLDACRALGRALHAAVSGQPKAGILGDLRPMAEAATHTNNTAATALAAGLWAFNSTDNFRDAVLLAANLGGNSDVVAAIAGQLAGAHYGFSAIPSSWRNGLMQKDLIESYADRLLAHALVALSG